LAVCLYLAGALLAVGLAVAALTLKGQPVASAVVAATGAVCLAIGAGLASPWVGAYQAARRRGKNPDQAL
jgi:hypothetical protein